MNPRRKRHARPRDETPQNNSLEEARCREARGLRALVDCNLFWADCRASPCVRAHACRGDARACFTRNWSALDESERAFRRDYVAALRARRSPDEAAQYALARALMARDRAADPAPCSSAARSPAPCATAAK